MKNPKFEDTEEIVPKFEDTEEIVPISKIESGLRGLGSGASLGFLDEIMAAFGTKGASPSQVIAEPEKAIEIEKQMMKDYDSNLEEQRVANKAAQEANPMTYGASEIVGGIAPGLLSGGGAAAANVVKAGATQGVKQAAKTAAVEGGKLGAKYGAASGAGYSEAETPLDLAADTAIGAGIGGAAGAALPLGVEGGKQVLSKALSGAKNLAKKIPGGELAGAAYKYGKQGKGISTEQLDNDLTTVATEVFENIKVKKKANDLIKVKEELDELGFKVNTKESVQNTITKLKELKKKDFLDENNKEILDKLETFSGIDKERQKMIEKLSKKLIKKNQSSNKVEQSVIAGEKKLAKEAIQKGSSLETVTDTVKEMDQLGLPFDTSNGRLSGVTGKFKNADGEEYTKKILADSTEYQPQVSEINLEGRTVFNTKDLGTGKIDTMVSGIKEKMSADLENMSIQDVDYLRDSLDKIVRAGDFKDPTIREAAELSKTLKGLSDEVVEKLGSSDLIEKRKTFSDIFAAEDLLGIRKNIGGPGKLGEQAKITQLMSKLTQEGNVKQRRELELAKNLLGEDVVTPQAKEQLGIINKLIPNAKVDADGNVSRTGLYKQAIGKGPNLVGQAVNRISTPISKVANKVGDLTSEQLTSFAGKLSTSSSKGAQMLGERLTEAMSKEGAMQSQAVWALSQSPAFREMIKRYSKESDKNLNELGEDAIEAITPDTEEQIDQGDEVDNLVMTPQEKKNKEMLDKVLDNQKESNVEPVEEENIVELEGKASNINEVTELGDLVDASKANRRIAGSSDYGLYYDKLGKLTSGIGHLVKSQEEAQNHINLSEEEAQELYQKDRMVNKGTMINDLSSSGVDFESLPDNAKKAVLDASFQMGSFKDFPSLKRALASGDFDEAAIQAMTTNGIGSSASLWLQQTPIRVRNFITTMTKNPEVLEMFDSLNADNRFDINPSEPENTPEVSDEEVENIIDRVNQQQSSGENTPMNQLDQLLGMINKLKISEEAIDELEEDATNMIGYNDGQLLKDKIKRLQGR